MTTVIAIESGLKSTDVKALSDAPLIPGQDLDVGRPEVVTSISGTLHNGRLINTGS